MGKRKNEYSSCQNDVIDVQVFLMSPQRRRERKDSERDIVCFYFEGEVSPCAPASCLNLPKHFGSLYLEPVFFPHAQKPASAVSVFKQAILRYPLSTAMDGGGIKQ